MRLRAFSYMKDSHEAAQRVVADLGAVALPLVGISASAGTLSCFVRLPPGATEQDNSLVPRTQLRVRGYSEIVLSTSDLIGGNEVFGFLVVHRPLLMGEEYQPDDASESIAFVPSVMAVPGTQTIGPSRCVRCNHSIPIARVRLIGTDCLCVRCQTQSEGARK